MLLEPEPALVRPNRVFSFGVRSVAGGRPRLDFTTSDVTFQLPGEPQRTVEARPAEAPIGGRVTFRGSDLSGHAVDLLVRHVSWLHAEAVDPIVWGVTTTGATVIATVQNVAGTQVVLPGVYLGEIRITLKPEDGLYLLPYMARQADGGAWEDDGAVPNAQLLDVKHA